MMGYEEQILTWLVDSQERKDPESGNARKASISITAKFPEYKEPLSDAHNDIETAIHHLISWGFVQCSKSQQGYYTKVVLLESELPKIYQFLHRTPKAELWEMQKNLLGKYVNQPETLAGRFCVAMQDRITQRKDIEYGLAKDMKLLEDVLWALVNIEKMTEETYIRNFSEMVFHDSKRLQSILNPITILVTSITGFLISNRIGEWGYRHRHEVATYQKQAYYLYNLMGDNALGKDFRVFGLKQWIDSMWDGMIRTSEAFVARREKVYIWINITDVVLTILRNGIAYAYLIYLVIGKELSAPEFLLYFAAVSEFATWVTNLLREVATLRKQCLELSTVQEYMDYPEQFCFEGGMEIPVAESYELRLDNISFRYPGSEEYIFKGLNLTIHPGEKIAIVGLNGAGKSTIVKLLCGFYDPDGGSVLLNGIDIRKYNRQEYYKLFSAVFQEYAHLDVTVAENVAQEVENIDFNRVNDAIEKAGLTKAVAELPKGLDTPVGRDVYLEGVLFSGGQMQRLMLARALYKDGPILVLDEPTAALDPLAEQDIYMKYNEMTVGKTAVFISHRLASTRFCDRIIFLSDGMVKEEGTHEELLKKNGGYAELFEVQSRYYQEGREFRGEE